MNTWCGYIDLLGTRAFAEQGDEIHSRSMLRFCVGIAEAYRVTKFKGNCVAASDGIFFDCIDIDAFYPFFTYLRNVLIGDDLFVRASFVKGEVITKNPVLAKAHVPGGRGLFIHQFGQHASKAYRLESALGGIGCFVEVMPKEPQPRYTVDNYAIAFDGRRSRTISFVDFAFSAFEADENCDASAEWGQPVRVLSRVLSAMRLASMESTYVASKYVPLLVNIVRSSSFEGASLSNGQWTHAPEILRRLVRSKSEMRGLWHVPGAPYVLLSMYEKLCNDNSQEPETSVHDALVRFIARIKSLRIGYGAIPTHVISSSTKVRLLKTMTKLD